MDNRYEKTKKLSTIAWMAFIGGYVLVFLMARSASVSVTLMSAIALAITAFLNFADTYRNGHGNMLSVIFPVILGVAYNFTSSTIRYSQLGYSAQSASATWKGFGTFMIILVIVIIVSRVIGKTKAKSELGY